MSESLKSVRFGWFLWSCQVVALAVLSLTLTVSILYAESQTETFEIENGSVEVTRVDGKIRNIKKTEKTGTPGQGTEKETKWEYDGNGNLVRKDEHEQRFQTEKGRVRRYFDEKREFRFDSRGRLTSLKTQTKSDVTDKTTTFTVVWNNGEPSVEFAQSDKVTKFGGSSTIPFSDLEAYYPELREDKSADSQYRKLLDEKRAWEFKKQFGQRTEDSQIAPISPAAPASYGHAGSGALALAARSGQPASGLLPDPSFYVGLFAGPSLTDVNGLDADYSDFNAFATLLGKKNLPCASSTMMSGGFRLGTWGNWGGLAPEWTKYIGFGTDFSYQKLNIKTGMGTYSQTIQPFGVSQFGNANFSSNGYLATWSFMVYGRYGFRPDNGISTLGTIQPFLGVGLGLGFARVEPKLQINGNFTRDFGRQSSVFPGIAVEAGVRYLPHRHVYLEASYRYFYGQPSFDGFRQQNFQYNFNPDITTQNFRFGIGVMF